MTHEEIHNLDAGNEESLQTLVRAIRLSQGEFSLILLRCNYAALRQHIVQRLHQLSPVEIREITLPASVKTLYTAIKSQLGDEQPKALMVFGLESVKDIDTVLTAANQVREEFRKNFPFPILLWINDQVLQKMIRLAADLDNWATTINFNNSTQNLIELLRQKTDDIFAGNVTPNRQICWELSTAQQDLQSREEFLDAAIQASLEFALGLHDYLYDRIDGALTQYQQSLGFWQESNNLERQGILLAHIALAYQRKATINEEENQGNWQTARIYFQQAIEILEQAQKPDLIAQYISKLGEVLRSLQAWSDLQSLAEQSLILHEDYGTPRQIAQDYGFLAEVALQNSHWEEAQHFAQQALEVLNIAISVGMQHPFTPPLNPVNGEGRVSIGLAGWGFLGLVSNQAGMILQPHELSFYRVLLARAQQGLGEVSAEISTLEQAKSESNVQYNPQLYISILLRLWELYFEQARYLDAFHLKLERLQIEQQFGFRAFVGASYLNPQRQAINPAQLQLENTETIAQEITVSSRVQDVRRLRERVSGTEHKLTVIHGQSGVGKSSILQGGLIPALQQQPIGERDALPILLRSYTDWLGMLGRKLVESVERLQGISLNSPDDIIEQLRNNERRNLLTVLIFDQFEEFFFVYQDQRQRRPFYEFLRVCLDIPFVKVILSLREDYLHYLLELDRIFDLKVINNNILDKNIRYYLGNFSPADAKTVIQSLTERTHFYLQPNLIDELVKDLAGEIGEVRPIELQIVGAQLQTEKITSLERYRQAGTKEKLVERFLEEVIKDCGADNEDSARLVLYLLTDDNGTRPLRAKSELAENLREADKLDLVLEIFVKSGLVLLVQESPTERYQLVHDYLVDLIRRQQKDELLEEYTKERNRRLQAEENLQREQAAKKILADANREAKQKIKQGQNRLALSSGLAIVLLVLAGIASIYAVNQLQAAKEADDKKQEAENKFKNAEGNYNQASLLLINAERRQIELNNKARELERKNRDAQNKLISAEKNKQTAETNLEAAKAETQTAQQNLDNAQANLRNTQQQAAKLATENQKAKQDIEAAKKQVDVAQAAVDRATKVQREAEANAKKAQANLKQAQVDSEKASQEAKAAQKGTELERAGVAALKQFEFAPIQGLISAMKSGRELQKLVKDGRTLEQYPAASPILALQTIVNNIRERNQLRGHVRGVKSVQFSPDGKYLATAGEDGTARLWDTTGKKLLQLRGYQDLVYSVQFSLDGKYLVTVEGYSTVRLWDISGKELAQLRGHQGGVYSVQFSPNGKYLVTAGGDGTARLWDISGKELVQLRGHQGGVYSVQFSPNGKYLATVGKDGVARLWDISGKELAQLRGHQGGVYSVQFSPDGKYLATAGGDGTARLWDTSGKEFVQLRGEINSVQFSPDGKYLATLGDNSKVKFWDISGKELAQFPGHEGKVTSVKFSPDGKYLATAGEDGTARLWDISGKELAQLHGHESGFLSMKFSPDGQRLATGEVGGMARLWDISGKELVQLHGHGSGVYSVQFSPDGQRLVIGGGDGIARLWNISGKELAQLRGYEGGIIAQFSPDGNYLATTGEGSTASIWNTSGKELAQIKHPLGVTSVQFSLDGKYLATTGEDDTARLWDLSGKELAQLHGHEGGFLSVQFSPNGKYLATLERDSTTRLWDILGKELAQLRGHQGKVNSVQFSPDGKYLATVGDHGTARLWDILGKELAQLRGHQGDVYSVQFSPDGQRLATFGGDNTVRFWDLAGRQIAEYEGTLRDISPTWQLIATSPKDNDYYSTVKIWRVESSLDELLARGCDWLRDYLQNNADVSERESGICKGN
ncbi:hypothetical protein H6G41_16525 [Tolypothrix sp. FACHB-123]|uniref:nSTAND1 domain-containing NTPase n=1 Tax=Tolypothrix sp. FACHB-123 TaxID=2692868 RepID=UPI001684D73B|nr:hypothetical protein [Tolypothrix sp. FACHB-123]MBD2356212.1 hypothetical protein [Tolypothrix sp. FACHB-123]